MSADAIYRISTALKDNLAAGLGEGLPPGTGPAVQLAAPGAPGGGNLLSLWLYQVTEDEFTRNRQPTQTKADALRPPPLRLNLHYLLTPLFATPEQDMQVLGRAMRWLYENAVMEVRTRPDSSIDQFADVVRIGVGVSDLEGLARLWEAVQQPYRLSVGYLVRTARIDPTTAEPVARVVDPVAGWVDPAVGREGGA